MYPYFLRQTWGIPKWKAGVVPLSLSQTLPDPRLLPLPLLILHQQLGLLLLLVPLHGTLFPKDPQGFLLMSFRFLLICHLVGLHPLTPCLEYHRHPPFMYILITIHPLTLPPAFSSEYNRIT